MNFGLRRRGFHPEPPSLMTQEVAAKAAPTKVGGAFTPNLPSSMLVFVDGPSPIITTERGESRSCNRDAEMNFGLRKKGLSPRTSVFDDEKSRLKPLLQKDAETNFGL